MEGRSADCCGFSDVAGSGMEHASFWNFQSSCFFASAVPWGSSYQLGGYQWRYGDGDYYFFLKHEIDTGEVIQQVRVPIADTDNVEVVHDKLMQLGGRLVIETVDAILEGNVKAIPQEEMAVVGELRPAPKIFKETCRINWNQPVKRVYDFIRGLSPYPAAWSELLNPEGEAVVVKIFESEKEEKVHALTPGSIITDGKHFLKVAVSDGFVNILSLQLPGKKRLKTDELLRGFHLTEAFRMKAE